MTEPFKLAPAGKDYLWGGEKLKTEYNKKIDLTPLAETWECSAHPDGPSVAASGPFIQKTLTEIIEKHPEYLGTKVNKEKGFPLLVKLIDAKKDLSVQVHPSDEYAEKFENGQNGKTEMWYVLDAEPDACLICGFEHDVSKEILQDAIKNGELLKHLKKIKVNKGDVFFIPSGTVHAIGAGITVAEIQENSNLTYRVYDYDRVDKNGNKRELHFDKACEVLDMKAGKDIVQAPKSLKFGRGYSMEVLCRCKYFETERMSIKRTVKIETDETSFNILLCTEGFARVQAQYQDKEIFMEKGDCVFVPADTGTVYISGDSVLLKIRV